MLLAICAKIARVKEKYDNSSIPRTDNELPRPVVGAFVAGGPTVGNCGRVVPEFGRWRDVEQLFGIKRGILYRKIADGTIKSVSLREPGKKFGVRLIYLKSVHDWLLQEMENQHGQTPKSQADASEQGCPASSTPKLSAPLKRPGANNSVNIEI